MDTLTTSTTTLASSLNPSTYGQQVSFTATVTGSNPTGTVTFADTTTGNSLNTVTLSAGSATIVTSGLGAGTHQIIAIYSGDAGNTGSISPSVVQIIHVVPTTITVTSSLNPSVAGQSVTFTASVTGTSGTPTGNVTFTLDGTAQTPVTLSAGRAAFITSTLTAGSHTLTAAYSGDQFNAASTSGPLTQTVNAPPPTTFQINSGGKAATPFSADTDFSGGSTYATLALPSARQASLMPRLPPSTKPSASATLPTPCRTSRPAPPTPCASTLLKSTGRPPARGCSTWRSTAAPRSDELRHLPGRRWSRTKPSWRRSQ